MWIGAAFLAGVAVGLAAAWIVYREYEWRMLVRSERDARERLELILERHISFSALDHRP
jgi:hypothetical protein